jgi:hypothetical protein
MRAAASEGGRAQPHRLRLQCARGEARGACNAGSPAAPSPRRPPTPSAFACPVPGLPRRRGSPTHAPPARGPAEGGAVLRRRREPALRYRPAGPACAFFTVCVFFTVSPAACRLPAEPAIFCWMRTRIGRSLPSVDAPAPKNGVECVPGSGAKCVWRRRHRRGAQVGRHRPRVARGSRTARAEGKSRTLDLDG